MTVIVATMPSGMYFQCLHAELPYNRNLPTSILFMDCCTLPTDQQFNLEFQFKSVFKLEFQPEFGIKLGIPILMGINLGG